MELRELVPPDMRRLEAAGHTRYLTHGPMTFAEVIDRARRDVEAEEAFECWLRGEPVPMMRHPRRKLRKLLFGR
jgi:hypothetical protein